MTSEYNRESPLGLVLNSTWEKADTLLGLFGAQANETSEKKLSATMERGMSALY
jgi:hypothetical protein